MKIIPTPELLALNDEDAAYTSIIDQAIQFAIDCGAAPEHAQKLQGVLDGRHAPAKLIAPSCYLVDVNAYLAENKIRREKTHGSVRVEPRDGRPPYTITVDDSVSQHPLLLCVERMSPATAQGSNLFWTYSLVIPETTTPNALCIGLDLNFNGEVYQLATSGRLYRVERFNPTTRIVETVDRLASLDLPTNILAFAVNAGIAGGMPILEARQNRMSRQELAAVRQQSRFTPPNLNVAPPPMVPAGSAPQAGNGFHDPFAGQ